MTDYEFNLIGPQRTPRQQHLLRQCDGLQNTLYGKNIGQTGRQLIKRDQGQQRRKSPFYFVLSDNEHKVVAFSRFAMTNSDAFTKFWSFTALEVSAWASFDRGNICGGRSAEIVALCIDVSRFKAESGTQDALLRAQIVEDMLERGREFLHSLNINRILVACDRGDMFVFSRIKYPRKQIQLAAGNKNISFIAFRISKTDFSEHVPKWGSNNSKPLRDEAPVTEPDAEPA